MFGLGAGSTFLYSHGPIRSLPIWLIDVKLGALAKFFKITPQEILVVHDELDVVPGQAKLKFGGSHAGHNGLRDIHAAGYKTAIAAGVQSVMVSFNSWNGI